MSFIEITKDVIFNAFTEKGDYAYESTGSYCLDFYASVGGMRFNLKMALMNFLKAYKEDPLTAIKLLFYTRDVRGGLGERSLFRYLFNTLANMYPSVAKQVVKYIPIYGRYDDLFAAFDTEIRRDVMDIIKEQLREDLENKKNNKPISLLAKWMPSINTSSDEVRDLAVRVSQSLGMTKEEYRKMLSCLRKDLIVENNLREKDYTFNYDEVPSNAMFKYQKAFFRNDGKRYNEYLDSVKQGNVKINSKVLYPYEVIRKFERGPYRLTDEEKISLDVIWNSFNREEITAKTIVVRDGSGSMLDDEQVSANSVATSLALLFAERLTGMFKNKFITFSSKPRLISVEGSSIEEKYKFICRYNDYTTTSIQKVYELIYKVYSHEKFRKEDALDRIVIISDMEFDEIKGFDASSYEYFKTLFAKKGFDLPEVVFWNVRSRHTHFPAKMSDNNVILVSGATPLIIDLISKYDISNSYDLMLKSLEKYSCFDNIKFE